MKKIWNKSILSIGGIALTTIPVFTSIAYIKNNNENIVEEKVVTKDFWYYTENKEELDELINPRFEDIAAIAREDEIVISFIESMDGRDLLEKDIIFKYIYSLNTSEENKLFLLQNYLDKYLSVSNLKKEFLEENEDEYFDAIEADLYDEEKTDSEDNEFDGEEEQFSPESFTEDEEEHHLSLRSSSAVSELQNINGSRYEMTAINIYNAQAWDMGENKGEYDRITGRYFSQVLKDRHNISRSGWYDYDADTSWWSRRVAFTFKDKITNATDVINLVYNTAKDTDWTNEDYAFVGIQGALVTKWAYDELGRKAPTIFGKPISFDLMKLYNIGAKIDNNYMISAHQIDAGDDDDFGNILAGVPHAPVLNAREGTRSLKLIAKSFYEYIYLKLNEGLLHSKLLHLYSSSYIDKDGNEKVNWYYDSSKKYILKHGVDRKVTDYNLFDKDTTWFYWSNQTLLETMNGDFNRDIKNSKDNLQNAISTYNTLTYLDNVLLAKMLDQISWFAKLTEKSKSLGAIFSSIAVNVSAFVALRDFSESAVEKFVIQLSIDVAKILGVVFLKATSKAIPIVNLASYLVDFSVMILNWIPSGNGYSIWSNTSDHGLNDWYYQWKNNFYSMIRTGENFSEDLKKGIVWRVEDGWFSLPNLFIATQDDLKYKDLSPNDEFNWGNKIGIHYRSY